tara:strand:- start:16 stop:432 length:417 start_codon:yes stop_codon:yes gene_type:complete
VSTLKADTIQNRGGGPVTLTKQEAVKYWLNYDARDQAVRGSLNQSSLSDDSAGNFTSAFTSAYSSSTDRCFLGGVHNRGASSESTGPERGISGMQMEGSVVASTAQVQLNTRMGSDQTNVGAEVDYRGTFASIIGDLA